MALSCQNHVTVCLSLEAEVEAWLRRGSEFGQGAGLSSWSFSLRRRVPVASLSIKGFFSTPVPLDLDSNIFCVFIVCASEI